MPRKRQILSQGALEYLITYGWALVMIATIIGVLVITTIGVNKDVCPNFRGAFMSLTCEKIYADGDKLELILRNSTGQKISLNPFTDICFDGKCGYVVVWKGGVKYDMQKIEITPGETIRIEALGTALASTTTITYEEAGTGMVRTVASGLYTGAPANVEIINNRIDDDGDEKIDCEDFIWKTCTYYMDAVTQTATYNNTVFLSKYGYFPGKSTCKGDYYSTVYWVDGNTAFIFYATNVLPGTRINFVNTGVMADYKKCPVDPVECPLVKEGLNIVFTRVKNNRFTNNKKVVATAIFNRRITISKPKIIVHIHRDNTYPTSTVACEYN